jgi:hypothetical protein
MLKKLVLWSIYSAFLGLLLAGAMYRTSVKLGDGEQNQSHGNQSRQEVNGTDADQSANEPTIANAGVEEHELKVSSIIASQVLDINNRGITLQLTDGSTVSVTGRAWRYAQALGFYTQVSDTLWLEGFYEGEHFEIMRMTNLEMNQSVSLRDETGHPLWNGN